jgi:hypothetical protein
MVPLFAKDLREHARALIAFSLLMLLMAWSIELAVAKEPGGSVLVGLRQFILSGVLLAASYVNHRLIAREYGEETALFLEALPISRIRTVTAKLLLGLVLFFAMSTSSASIMFAMDEKQMPSEMLAIALTRAAVFALFLHALFFSISFLGRYRIPLCLLLLAAVVVVDKYSKLELESLGPIDLIGSTFSGETSQLPIRSLVTALASAATLYLLGYFLAYLGDGAVTAFLARKMSQREKVFIAVVFVSTLVAATSIGDANQKEDFDLKEAIREQQPGVMIAIAVGPNETELREFAGRMLQELTALRDVFSIERLPPLFITTRADFEPRQIDVGDIGKAEGLMVRLRLPENGAEREEVTAEIVGGLLDHHTDHRVRLERRRWLLDGFAAWWVRRHTRFEDLSANRDYLLRALYTSDRVTEGDLERWLVLRDRTGDCTASALAFTGLAVLAKARGRDALMRTLDAGLLDVPPKDLRALFEEPTLDELLSVNAGISAAELLALWNAELETHRERERDVLASLPQLRGRLEIERLSPQTRRVGYRLLSPVDGPVRLLYLEIGPFDREIGAWDWRTEELPSERAREGGQLPETWSSGKRIAWTFAADVEALGCDVISGWTRETIE